MDSLAAVAATELDATSLVSVHLARAFRLFLRHRLPFIVFSPPDTNATAATAATAAATAAAAAARAAPPFSGNAALVLQHIEQLLLLHVHFKAITNRAATELMADADSNTPIRCLYTHPAAPSAAEKSARDDALQQQQQQQLQQEEADGCSLDLSDGDDAENGWAGDSFPSSPRSESGSPFSRVETPSPATGAAAAAAAAAAAGDSRSRVAADSETEREREARGEEEGDAAVSVDELLESAEPLCRPYGDWGSPPPAQQQQQQQQQQLQQQQQQQEEEGEDAAGCIGFLNYWISLDSAFMMREINTKSMEKAATEICPEEIRAAYASQNELIYAR